MITDLTMPGTDGCRLRRLIPEIPSVPVSIESPDRLGRKGESDAVDRLYVQTILF